MLINLNKLLDKLLKNRNLRRAKLISCSLKPYLKAGWKILDVGMGNGHIASIIKGDYDVIIQGIDTVNYNNTSIPITIYDGSKFPLDKNSYDAVLIVQALHHSENPEKILKEAFRIAQKKIIILEDIVHSQPHRFFCCIYDFLMNFRHGVSVPCNFKTVEELGTIFEKIGAGKLTVKRFSSDRWYSPMDARLFIFEIAK